MATLIELVCELQAMIEKGGFYDSTAIRSKIIDRLLTVVEQELDPAESDDDRTNILEREFGLHREWHEEN